MPYLRVMFDNQEIDRRDLAGSVVIGRCSQCEIPVRDILLSRSHCRIEPANGAWRVTDLASKNGTLLNGRPLTAATPINDGDMLRLGRVKAIFFAGCLADAGLTPMRAAPTRPADPHESMAGTYAGFAFLEPGESVHGMPVVAVGRNLPHPTPAPKTPAAFEREDIYSLLSSIASSSWDSIYAEARRPLRAAAGTSAMDDLQTLRPRVRPRSPIDLSLQVCQRTEIATPRLSRVRRIVSPRRSRFRRAFFSGAAWLTVVSVIILKCWIDGGSVLSTPPAAQAAVPPQSPAITAPQLVGNAAAALLPVFL